MQPQQHAAQFFQRRRTGVAILLRALAAARARISCQSIWRPMRSNCWRSSSPSSPGQRCATLPITASGVFSAVRQVAGLLSRLFEQLLFVVEHGVQFVDQWLHFGWVRALQPCRLPCRSCCSALAAGPAAPARAHLQPRGGPQRQASAASAAATVAAKLRVRPCSRVASAPTATPAVPQRRPVRRGASTSAAADRPGRRPRGLRRPQRQCRRRMVPPGARAQRGAPSTPTSQYQPPSGWLEGRVGWLGVEPPSIGHGASTDQPAVNASSCVCARSASSRSTWWRKSNTSSRPTTPSASVIHSAAAVSSRRRSERAVPRQRWPRPGASPGRAR